MSDQPIASIPIFGLDANDEVERRMFGLTGTPAYLQRALNVEAAVEGVFHLCGVQRNEWLGIAKIRWQVWQRTTRLQSSDARRNENQAALIKLEQIFAEIPSQRKTTFTISPPPARTCWRDLNDSITRFNQRWPKFLATIELESVNRLIEGYNRYYLIEKEYALRSPILARHGYVPKTILSQEALLDRFPLLPQLK